MVEDGPHGSVARGQVARGDAQKIQPAHDLPRDLVTGQGSYPGRSQFDPERIAVHQLADADNSQVILWRRIEPDVRPAGALHEQLHGRVLRAALRMSAVRNR